MIETTLTNDELADRLSELSDAVTKGKIAVDREFTMRVPAEPNRDADLVLAEAAKRLKQLADVQAKHTRLYDKAETAYNAYDGNGEEAFDELMEDLGREVHGSEMTHSKMLSRSRAYAKERVNASSGLVYWFEGRPFGWSATIDDPRKVAPGVKAIDIQDGEAFIATGGDRVGAREWEASR